MTEQKFNASREAPLKGVTVIELGTVISGPFTGSLLADLGAEVIKIEAPGRGDVQRFLGLKKDGVHPWWGVAARNKRLMTLDLKHLEGKAIFERLIRKADVLVENYRPGALKKLGFDWSRVHEINPGLVMVSISGYGGTGPLAGRPGFGKVAEGFSGAVALTGSPDEQPLFVGFSLADTCSGMFAAFGISLALYHRDIQNGKGSWIDLALYEPLFRMAECQLALERSGAMPLRRSSNDPYGWGIEQPDRPVFKCVKASDGQWLLLSLPSPKGNATIARPAGQSLEEWAEKLTSTELREAVLSAGGEIVPVMDGKSLADHEYLKACGDVVNLATAELGTFSAPGFIATPGDKSVPFCNASVGEHTEYVLSRHLGASVDEIARLRREGVV